MPSLPPICLDANLVIRLVTERTEIAVRELWDQWNMENRTIVAPMLLRYELTNALHRYAASGEMNQNDAISALHTGFRLPIHLHTDDDLHLRALDFAARFNLPAAYDAHYLALADKLQAEFWTADRWLANAVQPHLDWVRLAV